MRFWNSLSDVVLMSSTATCQVRLANVQGAGGSVLVLSGGRLEERICFRSICMCSFVVWTYFCRKRATRGSVRWGHPRKEVTANGTEESGLGGVSCASIEKG